MRPSIFDTSPPLFLDRPDSLTRRLPFDFRMSFLLLPWIYLVPCTISHIISFLFFIRHRIFFFCRRHTPPFTFRWTSTNFSALSLAHTPFQPFYSFFLSILYSFRHHFIISTFVFLFCCMFLFGCFIPLPIDDPFPHLFV
jgi:hypothetical protein